MDAPQSTRGEKERVQPIHSDVLASLRTAAEGLNAAAVDDGLPAEVADGFLAAATALFETGNRLHGQVASGLRVAGIGLRHAAKFLCTVTCYRCGLVHAEFIDCRVVFSDEPTLEEWLLKKTVVEDSTDEDDVPNIVPDSITNSINSVTDDMAK
ncbi:hypothetical protein GUJ93_ZPchr0006g43815 [Zizania palustris]|uniref:Uncharacterized protein n=1 Tax=Zizania palustris TaxID=103762 RepID=A0A8J5T1C2_ZIZPA|nr:hypothetical protein GUJ93_ZPchr0006g43815 [Zizania palustris]